MKKYAVKITIYSMDENIETTKPCDTLDEARVLFLSEVANYNKMYQANLGEAEITTHAYKYTLTLIDGYYSVEIITL